VTARANPDGPEGATSSVERNLFSKLLHHASVRSAGHRKPRMCVLTAGVIGSLFRPSAKLQDMRRNAPPSTALYRRDCGSW